MSTYPYGVRLDGRQHATGVYKQYLGQTTWTLPLADPNIDAIVLSDDFGPLAGHVITPSTVSGVTVTAPGKYDGGEVILGRLFGMSVELSQPFRRDQNGAAVVGDRIQVETVTTDHRNSGEYTVRAESPNRADRERTMTPANGADTEPEGTLRAFLNGDAARTAYFIESESPKPVTVAAVEFVGQVSTRSRA